MIVLILIAVCLLLLSVRAPRPEAWIVMGLSVIALILTALGRSSLPH